MSTTAVYAASFDPITVGHMSVIEQISKMFDKVIVLIATNSAKADNYMFSAEERRAMVNESTAHLSHVTADILRSGYTIHYAERIGATALIRGLRNEADFAEEKQIFTFNNHANPTIPTIFIMSAPDIAHISSNYVKNNCYDIPGWLDIIEKYVPAPVITFLAQQKIKSMCRQVGINDAHTEKIIKRQSSRAYHNIFHIIHMMEELSDFVSHGGNSEVSEHGRFYMNHYTLAALYHDIHIESDYLESLKSMAGERAQLMSIARIPRDIRDTMNLQMVERLISFTACSSGTPTPTEGWEKAFVDADFSILGQTPAVYDKYATGIRAEYVRSTDEDYRKGRTAFLQGLLDMDNIFSTSYFRDKYESRARQNIQNEIDKL